MTSEDKRYPLSVLAAEDAEKAAEHFRLAIAHLGKLQDVTPIPLNYALFYFYVAGVNTRFNAMMDDLIANGAAWDHEAAAALSCGFHALQRRLDGRSAAGAADCTQ